MFHNKAPSGASCKKALTQPPAIKGGAVEGTGPCPHRQRYYCTKPWVQAKPSQHPAPQGQALSAASPPLASGLIKAWDPELLLAQGYTMGLGCRTHPLPLTSHPLRKIPRDKNAWFLAQGPVWVPAAWEMGLYSKRTRPRTLGLNTQLETRPQASPTEQTLPRRGCQRQCSYPRQHQQMSLVLSSPGQWEQVAAPHSHPHKKGQIC